MRVEFWRDSIFWITFAILNFFWFLGFFVACKNRWATPRQMIRDYKRGICWVGHFGFWYLLLVLQPVLAWTTAKMWPTWSRYPEHISMFLAIAALIGIALQTFWSKQAGSSDAWSHAGRPNTVGMIHILHMIPEIGILLMIAWSALFGFMKPMMFGGLLVLLINHFQFGTHWPLQLWMPSWMPKDMRARGKLGAMQTAIYTVSTLVMLVCGFVLLSQD